MSGRFLWTMLASVWIYVAVFNLLSVGLNLRLRRRYPEVYDAVGRPPLVSRHADFFWSLSAHRGVLSVWDWRLRMVLVCLHCIGTLAAVTAGIWSAWAFFRAR